MRQAAVTGAAALGGLALGVTGLTLFALGATSPAKPDYRTNTGLLLAAAGAGALWWSAYKSPYARLR